MPVKRVAVIGTGAAGLCALRHLTAEPDEYEAVGFEQTDQVGGTWVYTDRVGTDENGRPIHSSMYTHLTTDIPKEVMAFPDFPFPDDLPSFMQHPTVLKYLQSYASYYDLCKHIKFHTAVENVKPIKCGAGDKVTWEVEAKNVKDATVDMPVEQFDAVMVCNGHFSIPLMPSLPGLDLFKGKLMHSHNYKGPEPFKDQTVITLGAGPSGLDIVLELCTVATKVHFCFRQPRLIKSLMPEKVMEHGTIKEVTATGVILDSGEAVDGDVIIVCTGYRYNFPFLTGDCRLKTKDERVVPLWKHLIHTKYPTLSVVGLPKYIVPFPLFDCQVRFVLAMLSGKIAAPSSREMEKEMTVDFEFRLSKGMPARYAHHLFPIQWAYNDSLADLAGFPRLPRVLEKLTNEVLSQAVVDFEHFRKANYHLKDLETFEKAE